ncbi:MAG: phytoene/squalene synthase family protein [Flavobacteriales bacterium]|nr:phytoene/squalene synthase family protein [Flavobacteriales bacterium]
MQCSALTTKAYSTSFSLGIRLLSAELQGPIHAVYGFVRFADEIVDTFHDFDKESLFARFKADTYRAIEERISLNPILNSFQWAFHTYDMDLAHVDKFLESMERDLDQTAYDRAGYDDYIVGSAEVVGLMCLSVFVKGDQEQYRALLPHARSLGAAFQKINFLRDLKADWAGLGRTYFPGLDLDVFDQKAKRTIEAEIQADFAHAYEGILRLPKSSRLGVYMAYIYYIRLFRKIQRLPHSRILEDRIRIPNRQKAWLLMGSYVRHQFNLL